MARWRCAAAILILAVAYYGGARLGLALGALPGNVTPVWPPTGLSIAAIVLLGPRVAPGVFLGALAANLFTPIPHATAVMMAIGNTLEAVVGAWGFERLSGNDGALTRMREVLWFATIAAGAATMISATVGVTALVATGVLPSADFVSTWSVWWTGDALGALVVGSAVLVFARQRGRTAGSVPEAVVLGLALAGVCVFVFGTSQPRAYFVFPFVIWAALRFAGRGSSATVVIVALIAIGRTAAGDGPFARGTATESLGNLAVYLGVLALTALVLAAIVAERDAASLRVADLGRQLQSKVEDLQHQQRLRDAQRMSRIGYWRLDARTKELDWSDEMYEIYGVEPATFTPTLDTFFGFVHPEEIDTMRAAVEAALTSGVGGRGDLRVIDGHGQERILWGESEAECDETGAVVALRGVRQDVTELRRDAERLREAEERFRLSFEGAPIGIALVGLDGSFLRVNQALCDIVGYGESELLRKTFQDITHPDDLATDLDYVRQLLSGERSSYQMDKRYFKKDGEVVWIQLNGSLVCDRDGLPSHFIAQIQDITTRRASEEALREANEAIREARDRALRASEMKSQFLANMSHEIRTPMNGVVGMAELLADSPLSPAQQGHVVALRSAATSLLGLLNDILDLARVEAGKVTLEATPFRVDTVVSETAALFTATAETKAIELDYDVAAVTDLWVRGDPTRLRQVLTNLVGNAVKFTEWGAVRMRATPEEGGWIRFDVIDTGIGIPDDLQSRLMMPFEQGDPSTTRRYGGSGLGLAISRELVSLMGGEITFTSEVGSGTSITVRVPLEAVTSPQPVNPAPPPSEPTVRQGSRGRVLLAEDNVINQRVARTMLERLGWSVVLVDNGQAAVDTAAEDDFDAVILDCQMPILDGYAAAEAIRRLPGRRGAVHVIAMTASAYAEDRDRCLAAGMNDYLSKPVTKELLAEILDRAVSVSG